MLYVAFLILVVVLTQFLSNSTVLAIILPVVFSITEGLGLKTFSFAVGLTIAGAMAATLANTTIGMSMVAVQVQRLIICWSVYLDGTGNIADFGTDLVVVGIIIE